MRPLETICDLEGLVTVRSICVFWDHLGPQEAAYLRGILRPQRPFGTTKDLLGHFGTLSETDLGVGEPGAQCGPAVAAGVPVAGHAAQAVARHGAHVVRGVGLRKRGERVLRWQIPGLF